MAGLLASAGPALAITMTWTNGNDVWTSTTAWTTNLLSGTDPAGLTNVTCVATTVTNATGTCTGGTGGWPQSGDSAQFTNDASYRVTASTSVTNLNNLIFSNTTGVVTIDASGSTLTVTNLVRIGSYGAAGTLIWGGGTLAATYNNAGSAGASFGIGSQTNSSGALIMTNGTVIAEGNISLGLTGGSGKLIVSGPSVFTNSIVAGAQPSGATLRTRTSGGEITITNGGKLFWFGEVRCESNSYIKVTDPNSLLSISNTAGSALTCGDLPGPGNLLIISNGAKAFVENGTISIGRNNGSSNTGIVVGAGSQLIARIGSGTAAGITIGVGSATHKDNDLLVYDGGYVYTDGAFFNIGGTGTNCSFHMGGVGAMSTGFVVTVRANSNQLNPLMVVTNAVFTCSVLGQQGASNNVLNVLAKGILIFSNQYAVSATTTNVLNGNNGRITIDGGTIRAVSGTNALGVRFGVSAGVPGCTLTITNGGQLLSELGTIGAGSTFNTGIVAGVGSVWSNSASITVGDSTGINNTLLIGGGAVLTGNLRVRSTNTIVFASGTLSVGGMTIDSNANSDVAFVVGDGINAAYYDMAPGDSGFHSFRTGGSPDLVVTNGAFLRGSGTLTGTIQVLGTFVPGFAGIVGSVLTSNSLSFGSSSAMNFDLGTISDSVSVGTDLKLAGTLNIADAGGFTTGDYTLFTYGGLLSASSTMPAIGTTPNPSYTYTIDTNTAGSVILHVTAASDPYSSWASFYGLSGGNAAGTADPDGDGMSNTNEFLTGFNPTNSSARLKIISIVRTDGTNNTVTYLGANGDSNGSLGPKTNVLDSTTGAANGSFSNNWTPTGLTNILTGGNGLGQVATFVHTNGAAGTTRYYRVRVLVP
jgi:fibronectin-binding autotransporter adhesin